MERRNHRAARFTTRISASLAKMTDRVRIVRHEVVPLCGSYEVRVEGQPSRYFYWDSVAGRRLRPDQLTQEEALARAQALARAERDKGG
jgi:predicted DNA-binding transcriptional regulator YafY